MVLEHLLKQLLLLLEQVEVFLTQLLQESR
jgi:hypothetical protein